MLIERPLLHCLELRGSQRAGDPCPRCRCHLLARRRPRTPSVPLRSSWRGGRFETSPRRTRTGGGRSPSRQSHRDHPKDQLLVGHSGTHPSQLVMCQDRSVLGPTFWSDGRCVGVLVCAANSATDRSMVQLDHGTWRPEEPKMMVCEFSIS